MAKEKQGAAAAENADEQETGLTQQLDPTALSSLQARIAAANAPQETLSAEKQTQKKQSVKTRNPVNPEEPEDEEPEDEDKPGDEDEESENEDEPEAEDEESEEGDESEDEDEKPEDEDEPEEGKTDKPKTEKKGDEKLENRAVMKMQKRIDKKTAQNHGLREENDRLKKEIETLKKGGESTEPSTADAQLAKHIAAAADEPALEKIESGLKQQRAYLRKLLEKDEITIPNDDGEEVPVTRKEVSAALANVEDALEGDVSARRRAFAAEKAKEVQAAASIKRAETVFPWFADKESVGRKWIEETLSDPDFESDKFLLLCYAFEGLNVNKSRRLAKTKTAQPQREEPPLKAPSASGGNNEQAGQTVSVNADGSLHQATLTSRIRKGFSNG